MTEILMIKEGTVDADSIARIEAAGILVIVTTDLQGYRFVSSEPLLPVNVLMQCAGTAINKSATSKEWFGHLVAEAISPPPPKQRPVDAAEIQALKEEVSALEFELREARAKANESDGVAGMTGRDETDA